MKTKRVNILLDLIKRTNNKYSEKKVMAFLLGTVYSIVGIADACIKGVEVHSEFYFTTAGLILGLLSVRAFTKFAAIKRGDPIDAPIEEVNINE